MAQASFRHRIIQRHRRRQRRVRAAMYDEAVRLARLAAARFRFRRLYLFGSVASSSRLAVWSDIDMAVQGLATEDYWPLLGALSAVAEYRLDLKPLEEMPAAARRQIETTGVVLYEAP